MRDDIQRLLEDALQTRELPDEDERMEGDAAGCGSSYARQARRHLAAAPAAFGDHRPSQEWRLDSSYHNPSDNPLILCAQAVALIVAEMERLMDRPEPWEEAWRP